MRIFDSGTKIIVAESAMQDMRAEVNFRTVISPYIKSCVVATGPSCTTGSDIYLAMN